MIRHENLDCVDSDDAETLFCNHYLFQLLIVGCRCAATCLARNSFPTFLRRFCLSEHDGHGLGLFLESYITKNRQFIRLLKLVSCFLSTGKKQCDWHFDLSTCICIWWKTATWHWCMCLERLWKLFHKVPWQWKQMASFQANGCTKHANIWSIFAILVKQTIFFIYF